jgi:predicted HAD superfamily Cof-like phosphohydrolase
LADYFKDVGTFMRRFGLPDHTQSRPHQLGPDEFAFRYQLIMEEARELGEAWAIDDLAEQVDALCDLIYVACGAAHHMGVDLDAHWAEVHRANMTKVRSRGADDPLGKRGSSLDVVKPPGWTPPDHAPILEKP